MKLAMVTLGGERRTAKVDGDDAVVLPSAAPDVDHCVRYGRQATDDVLAAVRSGDRRPLAELRLAPPLCRFNRDILCTGWNYWDHFTESRGKRAGQDPDEPPRHPTFFTKGPDTVIGPFDDIAWDPVVSEKWDYEAEVAVVIGRDGRDIAESDAMRHVFGFLVANDVSHRDLQRAHGGQWLKGKSVDATMPLGPWVTTADELADPHDLRIRCTVNGELRQDASTAQMAFSYARIIAELSWGMTLRAGDVILTGTPAGIGNARVPPVFLSAGDVVVTSVDGLGALHNHVVRAGE